MEEISSHVEETVGTEISTGKREHVETHTEHSIFENTPAVCDEYDDGEFDIITLFHVLEHFPEPDKQLRDIRRLLSDDGKLLIEVPNHDDWLPKVSTEYFDFYYQPVHVFYFTAETMTDLLQRAGFEGEIEYEQRYGLENARHWLEHGEPQSQSPSMVANGNDEIDNAYATVLKELGISDTLLAVASKT
jgi:SAM-dependent methyltransferase